MDGPAGIFACFGCAAGCGGGVAWGWVGGNWFEALTKLTNWSVAAIAKIRSV